jgi:hypothetical protein
MPTDDAARSLESVRPPHWAEGVLRLVLRPDDFETVSGDLLEEYRQTVYPARGGGRADRWFVRQVAGFVWRATWLWGGAFAALMVGRDALDWFVPPASFKTRALVTTYAAMSVFVAVGFWTAYRTRSLRASAFAGIATGLIAKVLSNIGALILLAIWQDPQTMQAIERSGGLAEVFTWPSVGMVVGAVVALTGGLLGKTAASLFQTTSHGPLRRWSNN